MEEGSRMQISQLRNFTYKVLFKSILKSTNEKTAPLPTTQVFNSNNASFTCSKKADSMPKDAETIASFFLGAFTANICGCVLPIKLGLSRYWKISKIIVIQNRSQNEALFQNQVHVLISRLSAMLLTKKTTEFTAEQAISFQKVSRHLAYLAQ